MINAEEWRPIPGWPAYAVSSFGRVRRILGGGSSFAGRFKKPIPHPKGYLQVSLCINCRCKTLKVARLVASAFLPNYRADLTVDHIDRVNTNNNVDNLRMATNSQNVKNKNRYRNNTTGATGVVFKRSRFEVNISVDKKKIYLGRFDSVQEAGDCYRAAALKFFGEFAPR